MTGDKKKLFTGNPAIEAVFCGVGEAFDENLPNTSVLVRFSHQYKSRYILFDCGFTAAPAFWKTASDPLDLDGVWISHLHGDHFLGLPQLLLRFSEHGRDKNLYICGVNGVRKAVTESMELAYPSKIKNLSFKIIFSEVDPSSPFDIAGISARAVDIEHPVPSLGVRCDFEGKSLFYTGDGKVPDPALPVIGDCELGIFETFTLDTPTPGHSSVLEAASVARACGVKHLAAVHMNRDQRRRNGPLVRETLVQAGVRGFLPEPGDSLQL